MEAKGKVLKRKNDTESLTNHSKLPQLIDQMVHIYRMLAGLQSTRKKKKRDKDKEQE